MVRLQEVPVEGLSRSTVFLAGSIKEKEVAKSFVRSGHLVGTGGSQGKGLEEAASQCLYLTAVFGRFAPVKLYQVEPILSGFFLKVTEVGIHEYADTLYLFGEAVKRFGDKAGRPLVKNQSDKIGAEFFQLLDLMAVFHAADFDKHSYGWVWKLYSLYLFDKIT